MALAQFFCYVLNYINRLNCIYQITQELGTESINNRTKMDQTIIIMVQKIVDDSNNRHFEFS